MAQEIKKSEEIKNKFPRNPEIFLDFFDFSYFLLVCIDFRGKQNVLLKKNWFFFNILNRINKFTFPEKAFSGAPDILNVARSLPRKFWDAHEFLWKSTYFYRKSDFLPNFLKY